MLDGLHIDLAALKTTEYILKLAGGQEHWFRQVLQHMGKQTHL